MKSAVSICMREFMNDLHYNDCITDWDFGNCVLLRKIGLNGFVIPSETLTVSLKISEGRS